MALGYTLSNAASTVTIPMRTSLSQYAGERDRETEGETETEIHSERERGGRDRAKRELLGLH